MARVHPACCLLPPPRPLQTASKPHTAKMAQEHMVLAVRGLLPPPATRSLLATPTPRPALSAPHRTPPRAEDATWAEPSRARERRLARSALPGQSRARGCAERTSRTWPARPRSARTGPAEQLAAPDSPSPIAPVQACAPPRRCPEHRPPPPGQGSDALLQQGVTVQGWGGGSSRLPAGCPAPRRLPFNPPPMEQTPTPLPHAPQREHKRKGTRRPSASQPPPPRSARPPPTQADGARTCMQRSPPAQCPRHAPHNARPADGARQAGRQGAARGRGPRGGGSSKGGANGRRTAADLICPLAAAAPATAAARRPPARSTERGKAGRQECAPPRVPTFHGNGGARAKRRRRRRGAPTSAAPTEPRARGREGRAAHQSEPVLSRLFFFFPFSGVAPPPCLPARGGVSGHAPFSFLGNGVSRADRKRLEPLRAAMGDFRVSMGADAEGWILGRLQPTRRSVLRDWRPFAG